jgi:hypothetical protein
VGESGIDLEDLIHAKTYVKAVNEYVADVGGQVQFEATLLPEESCARHKTVEKWCAKQGLPKPGKTAIANKVLELRGSEPLSEPHRRVTLRALQRAVASHFEADADADADADAETE